MSSWEDSNPDRCDKYINFKQQTQENYPLDVVDANRKVILKEIIILYGAKYLSDNLKNKNFKLSIGFFSLQENPVLLVPWMEYTIFSLPANTILYIVSAGIYFGTILIFLGVIYLIGALIFLCK